MKVGDKVLVNNHVIIIARFGRLVKYYFLSS